MTAKTKSKHRSEMLELYKLLLKSKKFLNWKPNGLLTADLRPKDPAVAEERHYTPDTLAEL